MSATSFLLEGDGEYIIDEIAMGLEHVNGTSDEVIITFYNNTTNESGDVPNEALFVSELITVVGKDWYSTLVPSLVCDYETKYWIGVEAVDPVSEFRSLWSGVSGHFDIAHNEELTEYEWVNDSNTQAEGVLRVSGTE